MRLLIFALAACGATAPAPVPPTTPATPVKGMFPELDYFVGRWHAQAKNPATGQAFELDYTIEPVLRGRWYRGTGSAPALDLEIHDLWGKDPVSGEIVRTIFDSAQTFGTVRSSGWKGDVLVFEGEVATNGGGRVLVRETIEKIGPDEFHAVWEAKSGDTWSPYSVETLRRR